MPYEDEDYQYFTQEEWDALIQEEIEERVQAQEAEEDQWYDHLEDLLSRAQKARGAKLTDKEAENFLSAYIEGGDEAAISVFENLHDLDTSNGRGAWMAERLTAPADSLSNTEPASSHAPAVEYDDDDGEDF